MAKVHMTYLDANKKPIKEETFNTSADSTYVFDDIGTRVHSDGEFSAIPDGTKEIVVRIECDF